MSAKNARVFQPAPSRAKQFAPAEVTRPSAAKSGASAATSSGEPSSTKRCDGPRSYSSTGSPEPGTPSAAKSSSVRSKTGFHFGSGCSIQPKTISAPSRWSSTGTTPAPVSIRSTIFCSGPPSTNAVPSVGCPANGSSVPGVKIRIRTSASSACGGSTKTVSEKFISFASACIVSGSRSRASVKTAS